jgi:hypothetical protein
MKYESFSLRAILCVLSIDGNLWLANNNYGILRQKHKSIREQSGEDYYRNVNKRTCVLHQWWLGGFSHEKQLGHAVKVSRSLGTY